MVRLNLSPRKQKILSMVVKHYIRWGEPVGSKLIADEIGVSSATVRNEMAELTEDGLLEQPHTSAGRIPSGLGYKAYIALVESELFISQSERLKIDSVLNSVSPDAEHILPAACELLSGEYTCVATAPGDGDARIRAVQFVQISRRTGMLILLAAGGVMKTRLFNCDFDLTAEITRIFFRIFNERVTGMLPSSVTPAFLQSMAVSFGEMSILMTSALMALYEASQDSLKPDCFVRGELNLFTHRELDRFTAARLGNLLQSPEGVRGFLKSRPQRTAVSFGDEGGVGAAGIVSAGYSAGDGHKGAFAVIGPVRMDYPWIISHINYVADKVGKTLADFTVQEI